MALRWRLLAPLFLIVSGCVALDERPREGREPPSHVSSFSSARAPDGGAPGWEEWSFSRFKAPTDYEFLEDAGTVVVKARADGSASGLRHELKINPVNHPLLTWRWKVNELIEAADNTRKETEDSPVRILVTFSGELDKLSLSDRLVFDNVYLLTGRRMPYATLVYIWENRVRRNTIIPNLHSSRIKMIVAESGPEHLGQWRKITRNIVDDYRRAFGEAPGMITSVGIMTDTDNTGTKAEAFYGDIRFLQTERGDE